MLWYNELHGWVLLPEKFKANRTQLTMLQLSRLVMFRVGQVQPTLSILPSVGAFLYSGAKSGLPSRLNKLASSIQVAHTQDHGRALNCHSSNSMNSYTISMQCKKLHSVDTR